MEIKGFVGVSLSDWDGKVSSVIFLPHCNLRCPFCYNKNLVLQPEEMPTIPFVQVENYLEANQEWIDGIVITGGEPTLHGDLLLLCEKIKKAGFEVKVDTNGTNPRVISRLIERRLVDSVAMDVKAPLNKDKYSSACGLNATPFLERINETIKILLTDVVEYEFRTTVVPKLHRLEDVEGICQAIKSCKKYALQNFKSEVETINPKYQNLKPFSQAQMEDFQQTAKKFVPNTVFRG
jgi:pyruvate formate lyase activating enzyme